VVLQVVYSKRFILNEQPNPDKNVVYYFSEFILQKKIAHYALCVTH